MPPRGSETSPSDAALDDASDSRFRRFFSFFLRFFSFLSCFLAAFLSFFFSFFLSFFRRFLSPLDDDDDDDDRVRVAPPPPNGAFISKSHTNQCARRRAASRGIIQIPSSQLNPKPYTFEFKHSKHAVEGVVARRS